MDCNLSGGLRSGDSLLLTIVIDTREIPSGIPDLLKQRLESFERSRVPPRERRVAVAHFQDPESVVHSPFKILNVIFRTLHRQEPGLKLRKGLECFRLFLRRGLLTIKPYVSP